MTSKEYIIKFLINYNSIFLDDVVKLDIIRELIKQNIDSHTDIRISKNLKTKRKN